MYRKDTILLATTIRVKETCQMGILSVSPNHYSMIVSMSFQAIFSSEKKKKMMVTTQILLSFNCKVKLKQGNN